MARIPNTAAIISSSNFSILGEKEKLEFSADYFDKLEILDPEKFLAEITSYISKIESKKKTVSILLTADVLYQQSLPLTDLDEVKKQAENFFKEIPLPQEILVKKTLTNDKEVYLLATNVELFSFVKEAFEKAGWTVDCILPLSLFFGFSKDNDVTKKDVEEVFENEGLFNSANFLSLAEPADMLEEELGKETKFPKKLFIILGALIAIILIVLLTRSVKLPAVFAPAPTPTQAPTPTLTPTPTVVPKEKGTLTVKILNGTGTPGDAGKVKTAMVALSYTSSNITTDNASNTDHTDTTVVFSSIVGKIERNELVKKLEGLFSKVTTSDADGSPTSDIVITTGN